MTASSETAPADATIDPVALKRRAKLGVLVLIVRTVVLQLTVLGGNVYLSRLLDPADFGAFAIVQFALAFFALFGDAGLGAALVQSKEEPSQRQMSSVWWTQVILASAVIAIVWLGANFILPLWPDMPRDATWLLRALSITLLFTVLRVPPSIYMERRLQYVRLSILDFFTQISFWVTAIVMARMKMGVLSLVSAVLVEGTVGLLLAYSMRPWKPSLVIDRVLLAPILKFGIAYQTRLIIGFANSAVTPLYAGAMLGRYRLGLNNWAQSTAFFPLQLVEIIGRVSFPLYSRLQDDKKHFAESLEKSIQVCAMATLFFVGLVLAMAPNIIRVLYTDKWMPALYPLYVYAIAISVGFLCPVVASALDAIGKPGVISRLSVYWTILNWVVVLLVMMKWRSVLAFAIAYSVHMVVGNILVMFAVKRLIPEARFLVSLRPAVLATIVLALVGRYAIAPWSNSPLTLTAGILTAALVYLATIALLDRSIIKTALAMIPRKSANPSP